MLAAVTLFASCSQEEIVSKTDGESLVSFTVTTPELGSRAAGDGATADKLYYAVYDEKGNIVTNVSKTGGQEFNMSDNVTLHLLNGETYSILFWAKNDECAAIFDPVNRTLSVPTTMESNNEKYDAFYAYVAPFTVAGSKQETVKMYRPFAQMNIATTARDIKGVNEYFNADVKRSKLVVTTATKMDLTNGVVSDEQEVTYSPSLFFNGEFPVSASYTYLAMNYLLVEAGKDLKDVTLHLYNSATTEETTTEETPVVSKVFTNVPVQRNYRTNIYGNLFTSQTDWSVTLLPEFGGEYTILKGNVTLEEDLVIDNTLLVNNGDVVLNLNGKKIINKLDNVSTDVIVVSEGSSLTINGEGTIEAVTGNDGYAIIADGIVTINGGTYISGVDANGDPNAVIYARGKGQVYVNGGNFPNDNKSKYVLNKKDADRVNTIIEVRGGTFGCFNPGNNSAEQDKTNPEATNFLAKGYSSIQVGDNYVVVEGTPATFITEFTENGVTTLSANAVASKKTEMKAGSTFDGGNNTFFVGGADLAAYYVPGTLRFIQTEGNATIQNITIDGNNASYKFDGDKSKEGLENYGIRGIFLTGAGEVIIDNVIFKNVTYTMNDDTAVKTIKVTNSILEGWTSYNPQTTATFEGCTFMAGPNTNGFAPHGETVVKDCSFKKDFKIYLNRMTTAKKTIKFINCTYDGTLITEANVGTIITDAGEGVIVW